MAFDPSYTQDAYTADSVSTEADNASALEAQRKAEAEAAGVQDARFVSYSDVLDIYQARSDSETLRDRRARSLAYNPEQQDFTRQAEYTGNSETDESSYPEDPDAVTP